MMDEPSKALTFPIRLDLLKRLTQTNWNKGAALNVALQEWLDLHHPEAKPESPMGVSAPLEVVPPPPKRKGVPYAERVVLYEKAGKDNLLYGDMLREREEELNAPQEVN